MDSFFVVVNDNKLRYIKLQRVCLKNMLHVFFFHQVNSRRPTSHRSTSHGNEIRSGSQIETSVSQSDYTSSSHSHPSPSTKNEAINMYTKTFEKAQHTQFKVEPSSHTQCDQDLSSNNSSATNAKERYSTDKHEKTRKSSNISVQETVVHNSPHRDHGVHHGSNHGSHHGSNHGSSSHSSVSIDCDMTCEVPAGFRDREQASVPLISPGCEDFGEGDNDILCDSVDSREGYGLEADV